MKASPNITKWKFKKFHKANISLYKLSESKLFFHLNAKFALQALEYGKLTFKQIESCRRTLRRGLGKTAQIIFHIFPSTPISKKPLASRMGKGKGGISY
jgi:large subunit ribosomal protein L16